MANEVNSNNSELLTIAEVASLLKVTRRGIQNWLKEGRIPHPLRIATILRWRKLDIIEWIDKGCPNLKKPFIPDEKTATRMANMRQRQADKRKARQMPDKFNINNSVSNIDNIPVEQLEALNGVKDIEKTDT